MLGWGAGLDAGMLYFDVRLAQSYPTVEIRVADVCTDVEDALLVALLARALVATVAAEPAPADLARRPAAGRRLAGRPARPRPATWSTRSTPRLVPARAVFDATVAHCRDALVEHGDLDLVQRRPSSGSSPAAPARPVSAGCFEAAGSLRGVVEDLARRTEESWA